MSQPNKNDGFLVPIPKTINTVAIPDLRAPAPNRGRHNEIVLEEEEYLRNLEKVVNRSFFPLLHAADLNQDPEDLENSTNLSGVDPSRVQRDVDVLTVNEFMGKYNSEDNVSLEKLMDQDEEAWKKKFWWIEKQAEDYKQKQLAIQASSDNKLNNMIEGNKQLAIMSADYEEKNNFMFMPATKSREIKTYSEPDSNEFKKIVYENTRFDANVLHQLNEQPLSRKSTSRSALPVDRLATPNLLGYDEKKKNKADESEKANNVRGFNVLSMPSPSPNMATPQMTWGEVEGTPLILDRERTFKIQETSRRDNLAANLPLELARKKKLAQSQQKQKIKDMLTPLSSRKESDLRRGSSVLLDSKKIKREGTQVSGLSKGAMSKPKIGGSSTITIDKKDLMKSSKGLPGDLLHFK